MIGPMILATAKVEFIVPIHTARVCSGITVVKMIRPPANIPDAPKPVIALPTIKTGDDGARAHTRFPISNTARYVRYVIFFGKRVNDLPANGWLAHLLGAVRTIPASS